MTQINWQYQVNNRAGGYIVTNTDWNDFAGNFRALIDQTTGSGTTDNSPLPIGIDLVNDRVYISDPDSTTPEDANHANTTLSVVGTTTLAGNTQQTGTFTVGVDDTGHDVKFFGATANSHLQWDESDDALILKNSGLSVVQDSDFPVIGLQAYSDTEATTGVIQFYKADGSAASPALVDDTAVLGRLSFYGYNGNAFSAGASIIAQIDGTPADNDMPTELVFQVTPDGGSETPVTALTIKPTGESRFTADNDITDFTADNHGVIGLYNSDGAVNDFTCLDFIGNGTQAAARIGMKYGSGGSLLYFGTTDNYSTGVKYVGMFINQAGLVGTGEGNGAGNDFVMYSNSTDDYIYWDHDSTLNGSKGTLRVIGDSQINTSGSSQSTSNIQFQMSQDYALYTDNTGPGSDNSRMWINGVDGAALYIGPRSGSHTWNLIRIGSATTISLLGAVTKTTGTFDIAHPSKGGDWRLRHSFIEGPNADNIYRGTTTISGSSATIDLDTVSGMTDGTWLALNTNPWSMVSSSGNAVTWSLSGKTLTINGPDGAVCSWMVIGERHDEIMKSEKSIHTNSDGKIIVEYEDADREACPEE